MHKKVTIPMYKILRFALGSEYKKLVARVTIEYANVAVSGANQHRVFYRLLLKFQPWLCCGQTLV